MKVRQPDTSVSPTEHPSRFWPPSPPDFLDQLANYVPQPRERRHRCHGVFAANHIELGVYRCVLTPSISRTGLRRGRTPRLSRVRTALLRLRPRGLHDVPHGLRRGLLLQGPRRVSVLQRPPHGTDRRTPRRSRHPAGARAAVGDLGAEAIAGHAGRPTPSRRGRRRHARLGEQRVFSGRFSSGSRSSTAMCPAIFRVSSTFSDTAPGRHSRLNGSP